MKKYLAIILSVLLLMTSLPLVTAEDVFNDVEFDWGQTPVPEEPVFMATTVVGKVGEEVQVKIYALNNPGIISAKICVEYDPSVLELVAKPTPGEDFPAARFAYSKNLTVVPYVINFCDGIAGENYTGELFATMTFKIKEDAPRGESPITLNFNCEDDMFDTSFDTVYFDGMSGGVYVLYPVTGVTLDKQELDLYNGASATLNAAVQAEGKADESVVWETSNANVVAVDKNGGITATGLGSAKVTVTTVDGGYTASCVVNVLCPHHNTIDVAAVPSTCVTHGHAAYTRCDDCGEVVDGSDAVLPLADHRHSGKVTTDATCGDEGVMTYTCSVCGDSYIEMIPATGNHTYDNACDTTCNVCGAIRKVEPHPYAVSVKDPTCGVDGLATYTCSICGDSYTEVIPATGLHSYGFVCDTDCDVCGHVRVADKPHKFSHQYDPDCNVCGALRQVPAIPENVSAFVVDDVKTRPGETFTVAIRTENNVGIISYKLLVHYDTALFELVSCEKGDFSEGGYSFSKTIDAVPYVINWCDALNPDNTTNGNVALLTFRVKAEIEEDVQSVISLSYDFEDVFNAANVAGGEGVYFKTVDGTVDIITVQPGDINEDGNVNNRDLAMLQQHLNGWGVTINTKAADVNADGNVNNRDLAMLQQYLNGWNVELK